MIENPTALRPEERAIGAVAHLAGLLPVWCLFINWGLMIYYRESSRRLVVHFQQAIMAHGVFLALFAVWGVVYILAGLAGVVLPPVGELLRRVNNLVIGLVYSGYALIALYGAWQTFQGKEFIYPIVGRRVVEGALGKPTVLE